MGYSLIVIGIVLILIGAIMYAFGFDIPIPRLGSAAIVIAVIGIIVAIIWLILVIAGQIPR